MSDLTEAQVEVVAPYKENDDFLPNPTDQFGTLDSSGTAGSAHANIKEVTPIFKIADAKDAITAARALDPDDDGVPSSAVIMPQGQNMVVVDEEAIKAKIVARAEALGDDLTIGGPTAAQKEAAEEGDKGATRAQSQQENQSGSASGHASGTDTARQTGKPAAKK